MRFERVGLRVIVSDRHLYAKPNSLGGSNHLPSLSARLFKSQFMIAIAVGTLIRGKLGVIAVVALSFRNKRGG